MKVDFQIVHTVSSDIKEYLLEALKETFENSTVITEEVEERPDNLEDWSTFNWIEIKYNYKTNKKSPLPMYEPLQPTYSPLENIDRDYMFIAGFSLNIEEHLRDVIKEFGDSLSDDENIEAVFKYFDEPMLRKHKDLGDEIFELEMRLREILSFIFIDTYKEDHYNLLREIDVKIQPLDKKSRPTEEYFKKYLENEFFFLLFKDYIHIGDVKKIGPGDLIDMIANSNDYEELKQNIQNRGIVKEEYQDLIASIKENIEPIEILRNCIAHNRAYSDNNITNYEWAKEGLKEAIDSFWRKMESE